MGGGGGILSPITNTLFGKPASAPAAPNYTQAAQATAQGNLESARAALAGSLIGQETPYGGLSYRESGTDRFGNPMYTAVQSLSPAQQELLNYDIATSKGLGQLSQTGLDYVRNMMANPFSTAGLPALQGNLQQPQMERIAGGPQLGQAGQAEQARGVNYGEQAQRVGEGPQLSALEAARSLRQSGPTENLQRSLGENVGMSGWDRASNLLMQRLEPQLQRQEQQLETRLASQGIPVGSEAYTRAKQDLAMQQNDARTQAQLQAQGIQQNLFGQELAAGQFGNQAVTQQQQNMLQNLGFSNQAQQQDYANRQAQLAFNNQMGQQGYQNQLAAQQANNAAIAQNFGQGLSAQQLQNQAAQQNFANQLSGMGFNNQQIQQMYQNQVAQQQANNALGQQQFSNQLTAANLANQARQQGFGELSYMRNEPLNTLNAVRSGAQVTGPSFVNTPQQAVTAGPDYLAATNALYSNQMAGYNAQQAAQANMNSGLMSLGGTLGAAAILSDPRTKQNVKAIGVMNNGLTLYSFEYKDEFKDHKLAGHGVHVGVMADEVEKVYPYAVTTMDDGYKVVNYGLIS